MKLLDDYLELQSKIHEYFGYTEDWRVIPLDDAREFFWFVDSTEKRVVGYADTEEDLKSRENNYYEDEIYTQRHLPKWVYRGEELTMVCCDPHVDGNKFLRVFDNSKERPQYSEEDDGM